MNTAFYTTVGLLIWGLSSLAQAADNCQVTLHGDDNMRFDQSEITVSSQCEAVTIELVHSGKLGANVMGHNVVVTLTGDFKDVAKAGMKAGPENGYVPADDDRVIGASDMIGGGQSTSLTITGNRLRAAEDYTFFCSFPGHWTMMKGKLVVN
ncbi:Electron transfer protein azurin I [Alloalcanivorax dieselolei B5]|uniref:Azurin n=1 Tax=Alcanivorax dieselolei (strain DSM 16502 / CGMCC 1.3690 / MCCC 1A00001 / B-5) TaxID=930169 RepID=K0CDF9_ALCDB|nr:azurin [Alloalcanivorax dieselolei]AFT69606.1 Electron transfer protein azurin I [Alloalcanivorax dieselolei B5]GGK03813.1 azurin [Alloalcanivorax dieselolei]